MNRTRVLIVDDSAFMRHALGRLLGEAPTLEVVGSAPNGQVGLEMARALRPDVITLDVEMPVLDGLGMLQRLMLETPTRVVMLSSVTTEGAQITLEALECGAIDFVSKPSGSLSIDIGRVGAELVSKITAAAAMSEASFLRHRQVAAMNLTGLSRRGRGAGALTGLPAVPAAAAPGGLRGQPAFSSPSPPPAASRLTAGPGSSPRTAINPPAIRTRSPEAPIAPSRAAAIFGPPTRPQRDVAVELTPARRLVVVASSTGGPSALSTLVRGLPPHLGASVLIVQHMPPGFTASLAARLDALCAIPCAEAAVDDLIADDRVLIAPGDRHLICSTSGHVQLVGLPPVNGVRPAADITLQAIAPIFRDRLLCVVLTGMGVDGREGARSVKAHGGTVYSQDEATSTIYGMPAAVAEAGLTDRVLPLQEIAAAIASWCGVDRAGRDRSAAPDADAFAGGPDRAAAAG